MSSVHGKSAEPNLGLPPFLKLPTGVPGTRAWELSRIFGAKQLLHAVIFHFRVLTRWFSFSHWYPETIPRNPSEFHTLSGRLGSHTGHLAMCGKLRKSAWDKISRNRRGSHGGTLAANSVVNCCKRSSWTMGWKGLKKRIETKLGNPITHHSATAFSWGCRGSRRYAKYISVLYISWDVRWMSGSTNAALCRTCCLQM